MYNLVHSFVAILKELDIIDEQAAAALSRELSTKILPSNPEDSMRQVEAAFKAVAKTLEGGIIKNEPWLVQIKSLEDRIKSLETQLKSKKSTK